MFFNKSAETLHIRSVDLWLTVLEKLHSVLLLSSSESTAYVL